MEQILDKRAICEWLKISEVTLNRWLADSRSGRGNFPLPRTRKGQKAKWFLGDLLVWHGQKPTNPAPLTIETPAAKNRRAEKVRKELLELGIETPNTLTPAMSGKGE